MQTTSKSGARLVKDQGKPAGQHDIPSESQVLEEIPALKIALVDDDSLVHLCWRAEHPDVELFDSPELLLAALQADPEKLGRWNVVVLDNSYGRKSPQSGLQLGRTLRDRGYRGCLLMASYVHHGGDYGEVFDKEIGKEVPSRQSLRALLLQT